MTAFIEFFINIGSLGLMIALFLLGVYTVIFIILSTIELIRAFFR